MRKPPDGNAAAFIIGILLMSLVTGTFGIVAYAYMATNGVPHPGWRVGVMFLIWVVGYFLSTLSWESK